MDPNDCMLNNAYNQTIKLGQQKSNIPALKLKTVKINETGFL